MVLSRSVISALLTVGAASSFTVLAVPIYTASATGSTAAVGAQTAMTTVSKTVDVLPTGDSSETFPRLSERTHDLDVFVDDGPSKHPGHDDPVVSEKDMAFGINIENRAVPTSASETGSAGTSQENLTLPQEKPSPQPGNAASASSRDERPPSSSNSSPGFESARNAQSLLEELPRKPLPQNDHSHKQLPPEVPSNRYSFRINPSLETPHGSSLRTTPIPTPPESVKEGLVTAGSVKVEGSSRPPTPPSLVNNSKTFVQKGQPGHDHQSNLEEEEGK